jgi:hypothetical protein
MTGKGVVVLKRNWPREREMVVASGWPYTAGEPRGMQNNTEQAAEVSQVGPMQETDI